MKTKQELLKEALNNVKNLGFKMVTSENIYYDEVYSSYFQNMLLQKKGSSKYLDDIINEVLEEIEIKTKLNP